MPPNQIILSTENYYKKLFCKYIYVLNQHAVTPETYTMLHIKKAGRKGVERFQKERCSYTSLWTMAFSVRQPPEQRL